MEFEAAQILRALRLASGHSFLVENDDMRRRIEADPSALDAIAREIAGQASAFILKEAVPDHSQCGEFRLLLRSLVNRSAAPGFVVDAGAHGRMGSNSYDLIAGFGWRGLLIEAFPERAAALRDEFGEGDYQVVHCAVGLAPGRQSLWLAPGGVITSLEEDYIRMFGVEARPIEVEVRRLADILTDARVPAEFDLLSIDIEGIDVPVFNDLIETSGFRPHYVIIEAQHALTKRFDDLGFAGAVLDGYREIGRTLPNLLLERVR